jgi:alkanesulfonate monooxygenase SsuD/methylene tetrahydromethanopterin reductase-like flavin-dependent oxidoreductase (luciferase family)
VIGGVRHVAVRVGVCVQPKIDDPDYAVRLEQRGYTSAWFADSPMIWSDCYASLALAAARTTRIRLGTGVAVAGLRLPTTTAAAIASINRMAPGRTFLAVGNGNTGWRLLGHKPLPVAALERELRTLRGLLAGETVDLKLRGKTTATSIQMADLGFVDVEHRIPLVVSAFGPRAMRLAAEVGDGVVTSLVGAAHISRARAAMGDRPVTGMTHAIVLRPGEAVDSPRVLEHAGATVLSTVHYMYDKWCDEGGATPPSALEPIWEEYVSAIAGAPARVRHQRVHAGHNTFVHPDERRFVIPELVDRFALVGTPDQLAQRLQALETAGLDELLLLPDLEHRDEDTEDFARHVLPRL